MNNNISLYQESKDGYMMPVFVQNPYRPEQLIEKYKLTEIKYEEKRMSLVKAIKHGKEHRKPFRGPKAVDGWCANHGKCWICRRNRLHKRIVELIKAKDEMKGDNETTQ